MTTTREAQLEAALVEIMASPHGSNEISSICSDALSTPATEPPGYVVVPKPGQNLMEVALWTELREAMIKDRPRASPPPKSLGANATAVIKQTVADYLTALAARPTPQPAADTRVVVKLAEALWYESEGGAVEPLYEVSNHAKFIPEYEAKARAILSAIIGNAPIDKIADAADIKPILDAIRSLLKWDAKRKYPLPYRVRDPIIAALRALAGKGETP